VDMTALPWLSRSPAHYDEWLRRCRPDPLSFCHKSGLAGTPAALYLSPSGVETAAPPRDGHGYDG
jgi:hypothetical protein